MNAEQKLILRDALVVAAVTAKPNSLPVNTYKEMARIAGFKVEAQEILQHLDYLVEKGFLVKESPELSQGIARWKATASAVDYVEKEGLV